MCRLNCPEQAGTVSGKVTHLDSQRCEKSASDTQKRDLLSMPIQPPESLSDPRRLLRLNRLISQKALQVDREFQGGLVTITRLLRHRLEDDTLQVPGDVLRQLRGRGGSSSTMALINAPGSDAMNAGRKVASS